MELRVPHEMRRTGIFRKPDDDDDYGTEIVHAKPMHEKYVRKLGNLGVGKDFVVGSQRSQNELAVIIGSTQQKNGDKCGPSSSNLSADELNKINAKILKAEMKGNMELANKLRQKLESQGGAEGAADTVQILMKTDKRSGLTVPVASEKRNGKSVKTSDGKYNLGSVESDYSSERSIREIAAEERTTSAEDELSLFSRAAKSAASCKTDDDWVVDDVILSHRRKRKHDEKDEARKHAKAIREHKADERTLDSCSLCVDSPRLPKHCLVAVGIKTYLSSVPWRPLVDGHCMIVPVSHYSSTVSLDEDVFDEMRVWRKGLVAMWKAEDMDCVFIETARNVKLRGHMFVECVPLPIEIGETAPIYFKKAINESEGEWADNKKLLDLSEKKGDIRKAVPKGFSYFSIDFGLQPGYAHLIEDESRFPKNFAHEVIGGMLDLEHTRWRKIEKLTTEEQKTNAERLKAQWAPFDWTEKVKKSLSER